MEPSRAKDQAERVTSRVRVHVIAFRYWSCPQRQHLRRDDGEVVDHHVNVELQG